MTKFAVGNGDAVGKSLNVPLASIDSCLINIDSSPS